MGLICGREVEVCWWVVEVCGRLGEIDGWRKFMEVR